MCGVIADILSDDDTAIEVLVAGEGAASWWQEGPISREGGRIL